MSGGLLGPDGQPIGGALATGLDPDRETARGSLAGQVVDLKQHLVRKARAAKLERWLQSERRRCARRGWRLLVTVVPEGYFEGRFIAKARLVPEADAIRRRMKRMDPPQAFVEGKCEFDADDATAADALMEAINVALTVAEEVE